MVDAADTAHSEGASGAPARAAGLVGQLLGGRYQVESLIGSGGMGAVYRAEHVQLHKTVALKVLNAEMAAHREAALRFEREALVSARLAHPNVVSATDSGRLPDGSLYLVLEYVAGRSLREVVDSEGRLPLPRALDIGAQIADALSAAHGAGIVHRDLKPGNVMLSPREGNPEFVKVLDFGLARAAGQASQSGEPLTRTGSVFGTPEYMSPEQARGEVVDHRSDLYSLGVILYELLSGKAPFQAPELVAILIKHLQEPPPPLPADLPAPLAEYVLSLLAKHPDQRPSEAQSVAKALRRFAPRPLSSRAPPRSAVTALDRGGLRQRAAATLMNLGVRATRLSWTEVGRQASSWTARLRELPESVVRWARSRRVGPPPHVLLFGAGALALFLTWLVWPGEADSELSARARRGEPEALGQLGAVPAAKRPARASLDLALGYFEAGDFERALDALEAALASDPDLASEPRAGAGVRRAVEHAATRERAIELAAQKLGAAGADVLFDVWASTPDKTPATRAAKKWLDAPELRERAPAVGIALAFREAKSCLAVLELLPKAVDLADERSLLPLKRFQSETGCGFLTLDDCYPCLRGDAVLDRAVEAARGRPAPKFEPK